MLREFRNDEKGYLRWAQENPHGFIANADEPARSPDYPMVHRATHRSMTSPTRKNYTSLWPRSRLSLAKDPVNHRGFGLFTEFR